MKKIMISLASIFLILSLMLTGCSRYVASYSAVAFVHSNTSRDATMSFMTFKGTMVFKLQCNEGEKIVASAQLEEGDVDVYYDIAGMKEFFFDINTGGSVSAVQGDLQKGTVYIIIETDGECKNGNFIFSVITN